jgi:hypothetical protein
MEATPAETRRTVLTEAAISILPNALFSAFFVWLLFRGTQRIGLWGTDGVAFDLVPTTFMLTLITTVLVTWLVRRRVAAGATKPAPGVTRLPRNRLVRGIVLGLMMVVLLVPVTVAALTQVWAGDWSFAQMLWFKIFYGVALGLIVTPLVVLAALRDR